MSNSYILVPKFLFKKILIKMCLIAPVIIVTNKRKGNMQNRLKSNTGQKAANV